MLNRVGQHDDRVASAVEAAAELASLRYVSDSEAGIRRIRSGKGFSYRDSGGAVVTADQKVRIKLLAIPPAWTDVWISRRADTHIQATGRDARGRKQYRYHDQWSLCRGETKFSALPSFADSLPKLRAAVDADLRRHGVPREKVIASIVWLLDNTLIRIGNSAYAKTNKSFGLTTLRGRHIDIDGSRVRFAFRGKSGKEWRVQIADRRMARIMRQIQELPGQQLFQYLDESGERRAIGSQEINDYLRAVSGEAFTSKHFRTWGGTIQAASLLAATPLPDTQAATKRTLNQVIDAVAARLNNTRAVCRACYIHPTVVASWAEGRLADELAAARKRKVSEGLDGEEAMVKHWLAAR